MFIRKTIPRVIAFCFIPTLVWSSPELHLVGTYEGYIRSQGEIHGPRANILVSRPGQSVSLVLSSVQPLRWYITPDSETEIVTIHLAGPAAKRSEVYVNSMLTTATILTLKARGTHEVSGPRVEAFIAALADQGLGPIASINGAYEASVEGFQVRTAASLSPREASPDPIALDDIPIDLARLINPANRPLKLARWRNGGIELDLPDGHHRRFEPDLSIPNISRPSQPVYISESNLILFSSDRGKMHRINTLSGDWSVRPSIMGWSGHGAIWDPEIGLITGMGLTGPGAISIIYRDGTPVSISLDETAAPGLRSLARQGGGPFVKIIPLGISDGKVLMTIDSRFANSRQEVFWLIDIETSVGQRVDTLTRSFCYEAQSTSSCTE